ncbi:uncharacterized protein LOC105256054 [Camponotus floridanus]|uniref:uncharacterized protein LOC105256054 n=1 Tax=Camponotus floridanus TaxID=104421 RepID=UPI00059B9763|nr:uncharacterized protein LOC105256054 [Camponotus floridanus]
MSRINAEVGTDYDDHQERNYVRVVQDEIFRTTDERNPLVKEEEIDLGFLDDLGGLAPYLPDTEDSSVPLNKEESSGGFFNWLLSMLGLTSLVVDEKIRDEESTEPKFNRSTSGSSGSFFNWLLSMLGLTSSVVDDTIKNKSSTDPKFNRSISNESKKLAKDR